MAPTTSIPFAAPVLAQTQVRLSLCSSLQGALAGSFHIESLQVFPDGFTAYYASVCVEPGDTPAPGEGFRVFRRDWLGWQDIGGEDILYYDAGCMTPLMPGRNVCCIVSNGENGQYTAILGRAVSPDVATVEVAFSNGHAGRMRVFNNKFAVVLPSIAESARLRAFDQNGLVLDDLPLDLSADARAAGDTGCLP